MKSRAKQHLAFFGVFVVLVAGMVYGFNRPPAIPILLRPESDASLAQATEVILSWKPSFGATEYKVKLWGGPYTMMVPCNWQKGTTCAIGQMWPGQMFWQVNARNESGTESEWSDIGSFTIGPLSPAPEKQEIEKREIP